MVLYNLQRGNNILKNLVVVYGLLMCVLVSLVCIYNAESGYGWYFIIPFFFGVYFFIFPGVIRYVDMSPGIILICFVSFARYVFSPLLTSLTGVYSISTSTSHFEQQYFEKAIILTFYEMTCIMFAIVFYKSRNRDVIKSTRKEMRENFKSFRTPFLIMFIILAILVVFQNPSLLDRYNFFITGSNTSVINSEVGSSLEMIILEVARYIFPLIFLPYFYRKYLITKKTRYIIYSIIPVLLSISFFVGTSRGSVIIPGIAYLFLLTNLYKERKKAIFISLATFIIILMVSTTIFKSFTLLERSFSLEWLERYLHIYFAGVKNVAVAISANDIFGSSISFSTFFSEFFRNFPGLSHLTTGIETTGNYFNLTNYSGRDINDQVIPTIGQGIMYLGYILSPTFSVIFVLIALKCDELLKSEYRIEKLFLYTLIAVNVGNNHVANLQLVAAFFSSWVIPLFILFKLNEYVVRMSTKKTGKKLTYK